jgi:hypothetical protein
MLFGGGKDVQYEELDLPGGIESTDYDNVYGEGGLKDEAGQ